MEHSHHVTSCESRSTKMQQPKEVTSRSFQCHSPIIETHDIRSKQKFDRYLYLHEHAKSNVRKMNKKGRNASCWSSGIGQGVK